MTAHRRPHRGARWLGYAVVLAVGLYFVGRAVTEVLTVDPRRPETYRHDWGGPHYLGVLLVHVGPTFLVLVVVALFAWRSSRARGPRRHRGTSQAP